MNCDNDKRNKKSSTNTVLQNPHFNPMGDLLPSTPWMEYEMDFVDGLHGFSNQSAESMSGAPPSSSRSFNVQQVPPLRIPSGNGNRDEYSSWDQAIASLKTPDSTDTGFLDQSTSASTATIHGNVHHHSINSNVPSNAMPHIVESQFFNSSLPMMDYSGYSSHPTVLQSAPPLFNTAACNPMFGGIGEDVLFGNGAPIFGNSDLSVCESSIFGSEIDASTMTTRDSNWSTFTPNPITKRTIADNSMSHGDLPRSQQIARTHNLPPKMGQRQKSTTHAMGKQRGRPSKYVRPKQVKYSAMNRAERERIRRRELKEGYEILTQMLELRVDNSLAALPERTEILIAACAEIKRLENLQYQQNRVNI